MRRHKILRLYNAGQFLRRMNHKHHQSQIASRSVSSMPCFAETSIIKHLQRCGAMRVQFFSVFRVQKKKTSSRRKASCAPQNSVYPVLNKKASSKCWVSRVQFLCVIHKIKNINVKKIGAYPTLFLRIFFGLPSDILRID